MTHAKSSSKELDDFLSKTISIVKCLSHRSMLNICIRLRKNNINLNYGNSKYPVSIGYNKNTFNPESNNKLYEIIKAIPLKIWNESKSYKYDKN